MGRREVMGSSADSVLFVAMSDSVVHEILVKASAHNTFLLPLETEPSRVEIILNLRTRAYTGWV